MNPDTNRFEPLHEEGGGSPNRHQRRAEAAQARRGGKALDSFAKALQGADVRLLRPDGTEVPEHWPIFTVGERLILKHYVFKVAYIGENTLLLEPAGPVLVGEAQSG